MRISDWSSDVCSSDLGIVEQREVDVCRRVRHVLTEEDLAQRLAAQGRRRATGVRMPGQERDMRLYTLAMTVERKLGFPPALAGRQLPPLDHPETALPQATSQ